MEALRIFPQFNNVTAGFSIKPEKAELLRGKMAQDCSRENRYLVRPYLVHGDHICCIKKEMLGMDHYIEIKDTDGLVTDIAGVVLTSTHGDCIPLYAYDPVKKVIGIAHSGWKGTGLGIAQRLIEVMKKEYGCNAFDIYTYIGPGIEKCHFEFGKEDAEKYFSKNIPWTKEYIFKHENPQKSYIDLKGINRHFFELAGVTKTEVSRDCTYCMNEKYYSYRRSGDKDRMLAYIEISL